MGTPKTRLVWAVSLALAVGCVAAQDNTRDHQLANDKTLGIVQMDDNPLQESLLSEIVPVLDAAQNLPAEASPARTYRSLMKPGLGHGPKRLKFVPRSATFLQLGEQQDGCECRPDAICEEGELPWCYVATQESCDDGIEECEGDVCDFWSESACKASGAASSGEAVVGAQHEKMLENNPQPEKTAAAAASSACNCKGGSEYGNQCVDDEDKPWCYVPFKTSCEDGIEECEGGLCQYWSEGACEAGAASATPAEATTPEATTPAADAPPVTTEACKCRGGAGEGNTCAKDGDDPAWCYVLSQNSCDDGIEECEDGVCQYWAESPCTASGAASSGEAVVNAQHKAMLKSQPPPPSTPGGTCRCKGGTAIGNTCEAEDDFPWCYVPSSQSCNDGIEECEGSSCQYWSEAACDAVAGTVAKKAAPAAKTSPKGACQCKGGPLPGNMCVSGDIDNFGMSWCYIPAKESCPDAVTGICENDHSCSFWSEAACAGAATPKAHAAIKTIPMTLRAPASQGGSCQCKGGSQPGNVCEAGSAGAYGTKWCYIPAPNSCVDAVKGICETDHSCNYWSELACVATPLPESRGHHDEHLQTAMKALDAAAKGYAPHKDSTEAAAALQSAVQALSNIKTQFADSYKGSLQVSQLQQQQHALLTNKAASANAASAKQYIQQMQYQLQLLKAAALAPPPASPPPSPAPPPPTIIIPQGGNQQAFVWPPQAAGVQQQAGAIVVNPPPPPPAPVPVPAASNQLLDVALAGVKSGLVQLDGVVNDGISTTEASPFTSALGAPIESDKKFTEDITKLMADVEGDNKA